MKLNLATVKSDGSGLQRTYAFPPRAPRDERFRVTLNYLSPSLFTETQQKERVKVKSAGRGRNEEEPSLKQIREVLAKEVLTRAVAKIEDVTLSKLTRLIPLKQDEVKAAGGLDVEIDMDEENVLFLLLNSFDFWSFVMDTCSDLSEFQDEDWREQLGNSESGADTSTDVA